MSELKSFLKNKTDFKDEYFYYFLPSYNYEKKAIIGEKIKKFNGVSIFTQIYIKN